MSRITKFESQNNKKSNTRQRLKPTKERKIWLWILGWLFIFPLPLTILLFGNKRISKSVKIVAIAVAWLFYLILVLLFGLFKSDNPAKTEDPTPIKTETIIPPVETTSSSESINVVEENNNPYTDLDAFIGNFNAAGGIQITSQDQIDIHDKTGGYYRTEFRLPAYDNAIAYHVVLGDGSSADLIDIPKLSGEMTDGTIARIYVLAVSKESFETIFRNACKVLHSEIVDIDIDDVLYKIMHPYRYEEMEYLYTSGSGVVGHYGYSYDIKEKENYYQFFLD